MKVNYKRGWFFLTRKEIKAIAEDIAKYKDSADFDCLKIFPDGTVYLDGHRVIEVHDPFPANDIQWHSVAEEGLPRHEGTYLVKSKDYNRYSIVPYGMHPDVTPDNCRYSHWAIIGPCNNE